MKITRAEFVKSAAASGDWPCEGLPEAAFLGRSNVGKSSLLNCLVQRKNLARTSTTPGRTRLINFFRINQQYMFADLPGYGYAKVSQDERRSWQQMVESYLAEREQLKLAVLLVDLRRVPGGEERELIGWLTGRGIPVVLAATKADKLTRSKQQAAQTEASRELGVPPEALVLFSAVTGQGREELWDRLRAGLD